LLAKRAAVGELVRLRKGVYACADEFAQLQWWEQRRLYIEAAVGTGRTDRILIHRSAADIWGIPTIGNSMEVQLLATNGTHGRTRAGIRFRQVPLLEPLEVRDGYTVTSRAQTVVDIAANSSFAHAVPVIDHVLRPDRIRGLRALHRDELRELAQSMPSSRNRRVERAIAFADPLAQLPGESYSRALMWLHGFPCPVLQHEVKDQYGGLVGIVDFYWPTFRLAGEFDGAVKYSRGEYLKDGTPRDVVIEEKKREDRIRATGLSMARWDWAAAWEPESFEPRGLIRILREAGLPQAKRSMPWPGM
jgi:hypothetical protein